MCGMLPKSEFSKNVLTHGRYPVHFTSDFSDSIDMQLFIDMALGVLSYVLACMGRGCTTGVPNVLCEFFVRNMPSFFEFGSGDSSAVLNQKKRKLTRP